MKKKSLLKLARISDASIINRVNLKGLICLFFFMASIHSVIAQNIEAMPLTHPDGDFNAAATNNLAQVAGSVVISETVYHAVRREQDGQFTDLPEMGGNVSWAYCMNELGEIAGFTVDAQGFGHVVVWESGGFRELEIPADAGFLPIPVDLNISGAATGYYTNTSNLTHALVWDSNGVVQLLPDDNGMQSATSAINDANEAVGLIVLADGTTRAYYWRQNSPLKSSSSTQLDDYTPLDIGTLGGLGAQANDINNNGQIVGMANFNPHNQFVHAFVWQDSVMVDLGTLGGDNSRANNINDDGFIVGRSLISDTVITKSDDVSRERGLLSNAIEIIHAENQVIPLKPLNITNISSSMNSTSDTEYNGFYSRYSRMRKMWNMMDFNDLTNGDSFSDFDDAMTPNLDRGFIGYDHETGFFLTRSDILFLDPDAFGGSPGYHWDPYSSYTAALADNMLLPPMKIFMGFGEYQEDVVIPSGIRQYYGTFRGLGHTEELNPAGLGVVINSGGFRMELNSSVSMDGGINNTRNFNGDVEIDGTFTIRPGFNSFFQEEVLLGSQGLMVIKSKEEASSKVTFGKGVMGTGSIRFEYGGTTQVDLGGDVEAKIVVAMMGMGNLLIDAGGFMLGDVAMDEGSLEAESDITQRRDAMLELNLGSFDLRSYSWTTSNPEPEAIIGGSRDAYLNGLLFRGFSTAGTYLFPIGDDKYYNPISLQYETDLDTEVTIGTKYGNKDDFNLKFSATYVDFPELGRKVELNALADPAWEIRSENSILGDPTVWVTPSSLGEVFGYNSLHLAAFDDGGNFNGLAGNDPSEVEYENIDGVVSICHPEVDLDGVRYLAAAFNWFLNPFDLTGDNFAPVGFTNINLNLQEFDIYINDMNIGFPLDFQQGTPYGAIPAGTQKVDFVDSDDPDNSNPILSKDIDFTKDIGVNLIVVPTISGDPDIIKLIPEMEPADPDMINVNFVHGHPGLGPVDFNILVDGETIVLGGLINYGESSETKSVPFLGDIPFLGRLFRSDQKQDRRNLVIFVTPTLVNGTKSFSKESETDFDLFVIDDLGRKLELHEVTSVEESMQYPSEIILQGNYPNPFDQITKIGYSLPVASPVRLTVSNMFGQTVHTLVDAQQQAGYHTIDWDGRDASGQDLAAGLYLYHIEAGNFKQTRTMMLVK